jgi:hypothetical protein
MAMPDFIGIGAQKAGTTWLYDMLAQNPSVWLPPLKEVHFFDSIGGGSGRKEKRNEHIAKLAERMEKGKIDKGSDGESAEKAAFLRSLVGNHLHTAEWYGSIFDHPDARDRVAGEITPAYLELDEGKMQTLAGMLPDTKFILIVREPAARAMSQLKMAVARSKTRPKGRQEWNFFLDRITTRSRGNYNTAIPLWQKSVGADRILIRPFSKVKHDPAGLIREIEDFIGAKPFDGYESLNEPSHKTKEVKVPDWVGEAIEERTAPQRDYLIEAFGEEFYKSTR